MSDVTRDSLIADLVGAWHTNEKVNEYLIDHVDDVAFTAKPPGGKGRTIAAIFAHMHSVRLMWLKAAGKGIELPEAAAADVTKAQAKQALGASAKAVEEMLRRSLEAGKVPGFPPNAASFLAYLLVHDAHHRGQIAMLARLSGNPLPAGVGFGLWEWNTRGKATGE